MAASRMSRIASWRLAFLSLAMATMLVAPVSSDTSSAVENLEDVELITASRNGNEFVAIDGADGDTKASTSPSDLKKNSLNKKFQKFYPKTEADWNFKGEGKKTDVFIKDAKDYRLLRIISEGLLHPQDVLPLGSDDAITSSHKNSSNEEMNVNVQPEGMSGIVNDGIAADSDEKMIMEKKKNGTVDTAAIKPENDSSTESEENVKINLDASAGVQNPSFNKQRGSITVPEQKQISLSKGKENNAHKKTYDSSGYDVIPLNKQREKHHTDEGVFDFVDSPLSDKQLVPAGTGQTSRINVKKGPNGQEYEYEYIYYYYEDGDEPAAGKNAGEKVAKGNEIPQSTSGPTQRTTTPFPRISSTPTPQFTQTFSDNTNNRVKSTEILTQAASPSIQLSQHSQPLQPSRDKFRSDFRYNADNSAPVSPQQIPQGPTKNSAANEVYWQYDSSRFPGRQAQPQPQPFSEQPLTVPQENVATTKQVSRGRVHFNQAATDDASHLVTASPISTQQPRETLTRSKPVPGTVRQPGLELVDSNSFRTHSTNVPVSYENTFSPAQTFETQRGKSLKQSSPQQEFSTVAETFPSSTFAPKTEVFKKEPPQEYVTNTDRFAPIQTTSPRIVFPSSTEPVVYNTAPLSTAPDNSLTTVYGPGLTDKAAHDLYAIYQQTQNEETVRNTISQDDRTTIVDEPANTFVRTNPPATHVFTIVSTTTTTTTTTPPPPPPTTTTTTTSTTTTPPPPPPTTTPASSAVPSSALPGRGRFRGTSSRHKFSLATTEAAQPADAAGESSEKPRPKFQPSHRREPGHRVSAYGRRGFSSTSTTAPEGDSSSAATASSNIETSSKSHLFTPSSRTRFRTTTARTDDGSSDSQSTSAPGPRPNFADRYNSRRRPGFRTSTTAAPEHAEEGSVKQETSNVESSSPADQQSTTFRSIRNRFNNNRPQGLRPGAKLNFSPRGKLGGVSSTSAPVPLDADTSGSADVPVEQKKEETSEHAVSQDAINETTISSIPTTTVASTTHSDPLSRLKHRSKLRVSSDKGGHAKIHAQQANSTAALNQNRRNLVHNLLPRKRQQSTTTEGQEGAAAAAVNEEKPESAPKPVTEETHEEAPPPPKSDTEVSESQSTAEASSTTESRLSSLIASRRHNLAGRRPGTFSRSSKQTATEES